MNRTIAIAPSGVVDPELWWDISDPETSEVRLSRLRDTLVVDGFRPGRVIEVQTQLARARAIQGRLDDAERTLDDAERALESHLGNMPRVRLLLERGRLLVLRKMPMVAKTPLMAAFELSTKARLDFQAIDAAQMMSVIEPRKQKRFWTARALAITEGSKNPRLSGWVGPLYADMGHHFEDLYRLGEALANFEKSAAHFQANDEPLKACDSGAHGGRILRLMKRPAEALALHRRFESTLEEHGASDGIVLEEIGECLLALDRPDEAMGYFARAHTKLSAGRWLTDNDPARLKRLKQLGKSARG
jgi:tetratricopeptide (TPR) repeat protein